MQRRMNMLGEDDGYFRNSWQSAPVCLGRTEKQLEEKGIGFAADLQNPNGPNIYLAKPDDMVFDDPKNQLIAQKMDELMKQKSDLERQIARVPNNLQLISQM